MSQRAAYKRGRLSQDRIDKLNSIGFSWSSKSEKMWLKRFKELKEFSADKGVDGIVDDKPHQITLVTQARGRAKRPLDLDKGVKVVMPMYSTADSALLRKWVRSQPKDIKEKRQLREFELFQQFLKWREENE